MNKKPDVNVLSVTLFNETNNGNQSGCKTFHSVRKEKNRGWTLIFFCKNDLSFKTLEVSNSNTDVIEFVNVKLHSPNKKKINIIGI